jgi:hypothetical protein
MKERNFVEKPFKVTKCDLEKAEDVKQQIFVAGGQRVMLDHDLARLYGVTTKRLNEQLRRNLDRFPEDFAFRLTLVEAKELAASRSQNATLNRGHNIKHAPHVFTEHGVIMLASVLNNKVAVEASIYVVRAFIKMRAALVEYGDLSRRIDALAATYDHRFQQVFTAIRDLMAIPDKSQRTIGFVKGSKRQRRERS